jgi:glycosyltransferase involved in cell wall biosynthesis
VGQPEMRLAAPSLTVAQLVCPTGMYGAERWILTLARNLDQRKVSTVVVTFGSKPGALAVHRRFRESGVEAAHVDGRRKLSLAGVNELRCLMRERGVHVLHTHGFKADVLGYLAARGRPMALVSTPHGWSADEGWRIAAYERIGRVFARRFDRVYPLSAPLKADLLARGFRRDQVHVVRNAVEDGPLESVYRDRERHLGGHRGVILFVGRLAVSKGVLDLIGAFACAAIPPGTEVWMVGEGPARDLVLRRARSLGVASRVRLLGYVDDVRPALKAADVLVLPSYSEGIPRTLMEAGAAGVPTVASDILGVRELIEHERNGLLVPPRHPQLLAAALERIYADDGLRATIVRSARDVIQRHYTAARQAREFEGEYLRLATPHRAGSRRP